MLASNTRIPALDKVPGSTEGVRARRHRILQVIARMGEFGIMAVEIARDIRELVGTVRNDLTALTTAGLVCDIAGKAPKMYILIQPDEEEPQLELRAPATVLAAVPSVQPPARPATPPPAPAAASPSMPAHAPMGRPGESVPSLAARARLTGPDSELTSPPVPILAVRPVRPPPGSLRGHPYSAKGRRRMRRWRAVFKHHVRPMLAVFHVSRGPLAEAHIAEISRKSGLPEAVIQNAFEEFRERAERTEAACSAWPKRQARRAAAERRQQKAYEARASRTREESDRYGGGSRGGGYGGGWGGY